MSLQEVMHILEMLKCLGFKQGPTPIFKDNQAMHRVSLEFKEQDQAPRMMFHFCVRGDQVEGGCGALLLNYDNHMEEAGQEALEGGC
eukprot:1666886-Rhodomonas_salina.5